MSANRPINEFVERSSEEIAAVHARLEDIGGFTVRATRCNHCLFSKDRLVMGEDAARKIKQMRETQTFFVCHEFVDYHQDAVEKPDEDNSKKPYSPTNVCCRGYYDVTDNDSQQIRIAKFFDSMEPNGFIRFVDRDGRTAVGAADVHEADTNDATPVITKPNL